MWGINQTFIDDCYDAVDDWNRDKLERFEEILIQSPRENMIPDISAQAGEVLDAIKDRLDILDPKRNQ